MDVYNNGTLLRQGKQLSMNISSSIRKLTQLFVVLFLALSGGLVYWQVVVAQQVTSNVHNGRHCLTNSAPVRGRIFDRNGVLLAYSTASDSPGVCGYVRHYTVPSLAGLIGFYGGPNYTSTGIEKQYDNYLSGDVGSSALNNIVNNTLHRPPVGSDIYLTIDSRIQKIADQSFDDPYVMGDGNSFASSRGSIIVTDPHSGDILAMVSRPSYDPNKLVQQLSLGNTSYYDQLARDPDQPLLERPLQSRYVPGSVYKTVTLVGALDSQKTTLNQQFDRQHALGPWTPPNSGHPVGPIGNNIDGYTYHFPVTTEYGFTHSDNVIFAQLGVSMGADSWLDYNKRFYVGEPIPFDLPVATSTVLNEGQQMDVDTLAANSYGQGTDFVTPFMMSLVDDAVANDGQLMQPRLIKQIVDTNKNPIVTNNATPLGSRQMSQQTAQAVRQAMYGVTFCGSGSLSVVKLGTSPYNIISKTGTGEVGDGKPAQSWLITQAPYDITNPAQMPKLTIVAMRERGGEGGQTNGPLVTSIYDQIFSTLKDYSVPTPSHPTNYCSTTQLLQTP
jgi:cell division protein FtsI/penicillin-binding protein 2